jgi:putative dimethyl sulfoxide reductase chaperone
MSTNELHRLPARADLARLLAAAFCEPDTAFDEEKLFDAIVDAAHRIDPELGALAAPLPAAFGAQSLQDLLIDYTRLFLGPEGALAQPYGAVWLAQGQGNSLVQDSTLAVEALYERAGFEVDEDVRELPDHVAIELEFLYMLLFGEAQALSQGDAGKGAEAATLRHEFIDGHLGRWIGPYTAAMAAGAKTEFYRSLAKLTERFVASEAGAAGVPAG